MTTFLHIFNTAETTNIRIGNDEVLIMAQYIISNGVSNPIPPLDSNTWIEFANYCIITLNDSRLPQRIRAKLLILFRSCVHNNNINNKINKSCTDLIHTHCGNTTKSNNSKLLTHLRTSTHTNENDIYFRTQSNTSLKCGLYALNHIKGIKFWSHKDLCLIDTQIGGSKLCNYRTGHYDLLLLITALENNGYEVAQVQVGSETQVLHNTHHFLIWKPCGDVGHWFVIKSIHGKWYLLDSLCTKVLKIQSSQVILYLKQAYNDMYTIRTQHGTILYISKTKLRFTDNSILFNNKKITVIAHTLHCQAFRII